MWQEFVGITSYRKEDGSERIHFSGFYTALKEAKSALRRSTTGELSTK